MQVKIKYLVDNCHWQTFAICEEKDAQDCLIDFRFAMPLLQFKIEKLVKCEKCHLADVNSEGMWCDPCIENAMDNMHFSICNNAEFYTQFIKDIING